MPDETTEPWVPPRLTLDTKLETRYCVDNWVRDEQVKLALQRPVGRVREGEPRDEPCAVVCFGPSLNDTWEKVKKFKYIFSCSGSHKFLVDNGIIPTWHVEVDPRPHKVKLIGTPQKETEYLIASACHPKVFEHLQDFNVKLWHVFSNEEEVQRLLPQGEWALTGGSSVGLRALTMARFFGFRDIHIFGMDGCFREDKGSHAAEHPNAIQKHCIIEYEGKEYRTATNVLMCAKETFHELNMLQDVNATFHGEGLVQAMAKNYVRQPAAKHCYIGQCKPELISDAYRQLNTQLHRENIAYGVGGGKHAAEVLKLSKQLKTTSILDFGCGKGYLAKAIPFPIWEYDPAIPGKDEAPRPADIVVCTDVLEHIEPENINHVIAELYRCCKTIGYFVIHTGPAGKILPDGRNTHLIQEDQNWWSMKLRKFFSVRWLDTKLPLIRCVVAPHPRRKMVQSVRQEHVA